MTETPPELGSGSSTPDYASQGLTRRQIRELERAHGAPSHDDLLAHSMEVQLAASRAANPFLAPTAEPIAAPELQITEDTVSEPVASVVEEPQIYAEPDLNDEAVEPISESLPEQIAQPLEEVVPERQAEPVALESAVAVSEVGGKAKNHLVIRHRKAAKTRSSSKPKNTKPELPKRTLTQKLLVAGVILTCGAFALATSIPANALLSESDVQRIQMESFLAEQVSLSNQNLTVSSDDSQTISAARESVGVTLAKSNGGSSSGVGTAGAIFGMDRLETNPPVSSGPIVWPVSPAHISSPYGYRWGSLHAGLDIDPPYGTPMSSVADGIVAAVYPAGTSSLGNCIIIDHNVNGVRFSTLYGHLASVNVSPGQSVSAGQNIGAVGNTGNSTGPHVHLEVHVNGTAIDPYPFMLQYAGNPPS